MSGASLFVPPPNQPLTADWSASRPTWPVDCNTLIRTRKTARFTEQQLVGFHAQDLQGEAGHQCNQEKAK